MNEAASRYTRLQLGLFRSRPLAALGIGFVLLLRWLYGLFYLGASINKIQRNYMFSDYPLQIFTRQLEQLDPNTLPAAYLREFIIPNYQFVGWFITLGEIAVTIGLLLGLCTRWAAALALWITINIGLGGYYDASLIPLGLITVLFIVLPTGHWLGLDRRLHQRHPGSIWFK